MIDTVGGSANCLASGVQVGEYRLLDVIGEGGFGIVYRARDISLDRVVAIKEYMPATLAGRKSSNEIHVRSQHRGAFDAGLRSFINEARLLAKFSHPALVHVYRFFEFNGTAYMVMRHYEGQTFREFLTSQQERMNQRMLAAIIGPVLDVVEMLHAADCYHRDIAPDNVFLQNSGMPVLLDFGAARRIIGDMTQALTMVLKPGFAPIEQYVDDGAMPQGAWTDIYQIGAMLYLAITGKAPATSVARMINDPVAPLSTTKYPGYSAQFLHGVDRALAVKPQDRPQTIAELKELLGITTFTMPVSAPWHDAPPSASPTAAQPLVPTLAPHAHAVAVATPPASARIEAAPVTTVAATGPNPPAQNLPSQPSLPDAAAPSTPAASNSLDAIFAITPPSPGSNHLDEPFADTVAAVPVAPAATPAPQTAPSKPVAMPPVPEPASKSGPARKPATASGQPSKTVSRTTPIRWAAVAAAVVVATALAVWWGVQSNSADKPSEVVALDVDTQQWQEAQAAGTVTALDAYLSAYPTGKHRSEAMAMISRLEVQVPPAPPPSAAASGATDAGATAQPSPDRPGTPAGPTTAATTPTTPAIPTPPPPKAEEPVVAVKPPAKPVGDVGRVVLRISPWGKVSVNGSAVGTTPPMSYVELAEGTHRIEISNPAAATVVKTVHVKKGEPVVISHQFE